MVILSHRGYWKQPQEKNTEEAFRRSFSLGFGTETDLRDLDGDIVISHDMPLMGAMTFQKFLEIFSEYDPKLPLALNVKADGLQLTIKEVLNSFPEVTNYFFFDMSVPDTLAYQKAKLPFYSRRSEYEDASALDKHASGIWLDGFHSVWYDEAFLHESMKENKRICIVSEDLHGRNAKEQWTNLKKWGLSKSMGSLISICTDFPKTCKAYFNDEN
jgi:hypothetical protein